MSFHYRQVKAEVKKLNPLVEDNQKIKMEPSFKKVNAKLLSTAQECGLALNDVGQLFLISMKWTDSLRFRAMNNQNLAERGTLQRSMSINARPIALDQQRLKNLKEKLADLCMTDSPHPEEKEQIKMLREEIQMQEWALEKDEVHFKSGKVLLVADKVMYELAKFLSKNLSRDRGSAKIARAFAGEILETIYFLPKPKTGWEKKVGAAVSRQEKLRSAIKKK